MAACPSWQASTCRSGRWTRGSRRARTRSPQHPVPGISSSWSLVSTEGRSRHGSSSCRPAHVSSWARLPVGSDWSATTVGITCWSRPAAASRHCSPWQPSSALARGPHGRSRSTACGSKRSLPVAPFSNGSTARGCGIGPACRDRGTPRAGAGWQAGSTGTSRICSSATALPPTAPSPTCAATPRWSLPARHACWHGLPRCQHPHGGVHDRRHGLTRWRSGGRA